MKTLYLSGCGLLNATSVWKTVCNYSHMACTAHCLYSTQLQPTERLNPAKAGAMRGIRTRTFYEIETTSDSVLQWTVSHYFRACISTISHLFMSRVNYFIMSANTRNCILKKFISLNVGSGFAHTKWRRLDREGRKRKKENVPGSGRSMLHADLLQALKGKHSSALRFQQRGL